MRIACLLLFLPLVGFAQPSGSGQKTPAAIKPLTIGDTVQDVLLENIINYPSPSARLSQFKGKLIIVNDKILNRLFRHSAIPFYVLIDSDGTIKGTFIGDELNVDAITSLASKNIDAP